VASPIRCILASTGSVHGDADRTRPTPPREAESSQAGTLTALLARGAADRGGSSFPQIRRSSFLPLSPSGWSGVAGERGKGDVARMRLCDCGKRVEALEADLGEAKQGISALQSAHRLLEHEWTETHRKLLNTLRSVTRSGGKKAQVESEDSETASTPGLDPISEKILARRRGPRAVPHDVAEAAG